MKTYVLTKDQLRLAVLIGAKEQGIIPEDVAASFYNSPSEIVFEKAENGATITVPFLMPDEREELYTLKTPVEVSQNNPDEDEEDPEPQAVLESNVPGDSHIKEALSIVMARPPGLNTIKSWTWRQKTAAWRWATHLDPMPPRPAFIKERKARSTSPIIEAAIEHAEDSVAQYFSES